MMGLQHGPPMIEVMGWKLVCTHNIIPDVYSVEIFFIMWFTI